MTDHVETTLPALVFTVASVAGDVPALARLVIDNDASLDWWGVISALESSAAYDITAASAALLFQAETRTPLGGSATAVGPTGASGTGSNVVRNTALAQIDVAILSTQASGGGAHLTHAGGTFRVFARAQVPATNTGLVTLALQWSTGDFSNWSQNVSATIPATLEANWVLVDLGLVTLPDSSERWEGRIVARSTVVGDDIDLDTLFIAPATTHYGVAESVLRIPTPTTFAGRDEFDQAGGNLNAVVAPVGGSWATTGATTDLAISGGILTRSATTDTGINGRLATLGSAMTTTAVKLDVNLNAVGPESGLLLRYVDASNYVTVFLDTNGFAVNYRVVVAGSIVATGDLSYAFTLATTHTLFAYADPVGNLFVWAYPQGTTNGTVGSPAIVARLSQLATGGVLASGKVGVRDFCNTGTSFRAYDNFAAWVPTPDAAVFAGQSLEVQSDRVVREIAAGGVLSTPASYTGNYLLVPPAGAEARTARVIVKPLYAFEQAPGVRLDDRIDDLSAQLSITPRYLVVPSS